MMTQRDTRFQDEAERIKIVYEEIDVALSTMLGNDRVTVNEVTSEFCELIMKLTGTTSSGAHDSDKALVGRRAALHWLRNRGYLQS